MKKIVSEYQLLTYIYTHIEVSSQELKEYFSISTSTVNRLLRILKTENWIDFKDYLIVFKPATYFFYNIRQEVQEKNILAQFAITTVFENATICLAGSSITVSLMCFFIILYKKNITIISNSVVVLKIFLDLRELAAKNNISLVTLGGLLQQESNSFGGEYAEQIISNFNIDQSFIGVESISLEKNGVYTSILQEKNIINLIRKNSKINYIVCLKDKFYRQELYKWANVTDFDGIISDYDAGLDLLYTNMIISPR